MPSMAAFLAENLDRLSEDRRRSPSLTMPADLHPDTKRLVVEFAEALAAKLRDAEVKYGYSNLWLLNDWEKRCRAGLYKHLAKGGSRAGRIRRRPL